MHWVFSVETNESYFKMAYNDSSEYCNVDLSMFDYSKHTKHMFDIDLTCYETFYEVEKESTKELREGDQGRSEMSATNETVVSWFSRVPDVDNTSKNKDNGVHDVLDLYDLVRGELFGDVSPEDTASTCLSYELESPDFHQVPASVNIAEATESAKRSSSPACTPASKARSEVGLSCEKGATSSTSESDSQDSDSDARVPSSCIHNFHPTGWYHIEE